MSEIVIAGAARTPIGGFQGALSSVPATALGSHAIQAALADAKAPEVTVDEVLMGCVLPAGLGQAPARQAALGAGLNHSVPCTTINKVCGSGMKTAMLAFDQLALGRAKVMVAGGMESMSRAPYLSEKMRAGARLGHSEMKDHMFLDGLEDAYERGSLMGSFAELCADHYQFTRDEQDVYALASLSNALTATEAGHFDGEIAQMTIPSRKGDVEIRVDEQPQSARPDKIPLLKPAFRADGTVTAANASSISDGGSAIVMADRNFAETQGMRVRARVLGHATFAQTPNWFTTAPIKAAEKLLDQVGWTTSDVDLWEVNEAFAVVAMAFMRDLGLPRDVVNVNGGACAIGHPIGASGSRIIVTLLNALQTRDLKRGVAAICLGGGEATAIAIERV